MPTHINLMDEVDLVDLNSLHENFYKNDFNAEEFILQMFDRNSETFDIQRNILHYCKYQDLVDTQLLKSVAKNGDRLVKGISMVKNVNDELQMASIICKNGRNYLKNAKNGLSAEGLEILHLTQQRSHLFELLKCSFVLSSISQHIAKFKAALNSNDFVFAIEQYGYLLKLLKYFSSFSAVDYLISKSDDFVSSIEEKLEIAFKICCSNFDPASYMCIVNGYILILKSSKFADVQQSFYIQLMAQEYIKSLSDLLSLLNTTQPKNQNIKDFGAALATESDFITGLGKILDSTMNVFYNYIQTIERLYEEEQKDNASLSTKKFYGDIRSKVERAKCNIWEEAQRKICSYLSAKPIIKYKYESIIEIFHLLNKITAIGDHFSQIPTSILHSAVKQYSISYWNEFHQSRMEGIAEIIRNETWTRLPMTEFSVNISTLSGDHAEIETLKSLMASMSTSEFLKRYKQIFQAKTKLSSQTPFPNHVGEIIIKEIPVMSSSASIVVKTLLEYFQIMEIVSNIDQSLLTSLQDYLNFFLWNLFSYATIETPMAELLNMPQALPLKLKKQISEWKDRSSNKNSQLMLVANSANFSSPLTLYSLAERIVCCESLVFVHCILTNLKQTILNQISRSNQTIIGLLYGSTIELIPELQHFIYKCIIKKLIPFDTITGTVTSQKWEMTEIPSKQNPYIDIVIREFSSLKARFDQFGSRIPSNVYDLLWTIAAEQAVYSLIDGYSRIKKCSAEGRGSMIIDIRILQDFFKQHLKIFPFPKISLAFNYIQAFYKSEDELEHWITSNDGQAYTPKQKLTVVNTVMSYSTNKKLKQKLTAMLDMSDMTSAINLVNNM